MSPNTMCNVTNPKDQLGTLTHDACSVFAGDSQMMLNETIVSVEALVSIYPTCTALPPEFNANNLFSVKCSSVRSN